MSDLIFLSGDLRACQCVFCELDEDALVRLSRVHPDGRAGELCRQLVHTTKLDARVFALDEKGRDWRVMGNLFGDERDPPLPIVLL